MTNYSVTKIFDHAKFDRKNSGSLSPRINFYTGD